MNIVSCHARVTYARVTCAIHLQFHKSQVLMFIYVHFVSSDPQHYITLLNHLFTSLTIPPRIHTDQSKYQPLARISSIPYKCDAEKAYAEIEHLKQEMKSLGTRPSYALIQSLQTQEMKYKEKYQSRWC